ncbi:LPS export ABC transporter periplasmic protein LptC [Shewanella intestini]|uniref:Lipopolysaccharide export system protein LptC n=1 Tax=Shewanella intestini TaxID=2017544 RepID=A0ABS5I2Q4_9GAMM|nr:MULTISPECIES: LPS export ABC transporter periplasmic protein LptC [Shewanella]MBR9727625.1 LPS export ABC transporter periplasmic protein LptC [Shewanella intestini]MRG35225.1 LPS export ABC transporter periplasmic protein LptC [Shewanella sp. XMDDZSB0408]
MNRVTWAIIAFFGAAIILYWQVQVKRNAQQAQIGTSIERPDFIANNLKTITFNEQGIVDSKVTAKHMEHFESTNMTHFTQPVYLVYPQDGQAQWRLSANKGKLDKDSGLVTLSDDVLIDAIDVNEPLQSLKTQYIQLDLNTLIGTSSKQVIINGNGFSIKGIGLHADLNTRELTLLEQVQGIYEPR